MSFRPLRAHRTDMRQQRPLEALRARRRGPLQNGRTEFFGLIMKTSEPKRRAYRLVLAPATCALALAGACGGEEFGMVTGPLGGTGGAGPDAGRSGHDGASNHAGAGMSSTGGALSASSGAAGEAGIQGISNDSGGAGGTVATETHGSSGAPSGGGVAEVGGEGGSAGALDAEPGGQGGVLEGGSGGAAQGGESAAGVPGTAGGKGCNALEWYPDGDGDGYGRSSGKVVSCMKPNSGKWVNLGGDCNDDNDAVLPDPRRARFSGVSFITPEGSESFDYDCSGTEVSDPSQLGAAPTCGGLTLLDCAGKAPGFQPTSHAGPGLNPLCGSDRIVRCVASGLTCVASVETVSERHRCR